MASEREELTDEAPAPCPTCGMPIEPEAAERYRERIDAHAADRAALVAQLEAARAERDGARVIAEQADAYREAAEAQVAELTRERDEARRQRDQHVTWREEERAEVARLTEALAAANTECDSRAVAMRELRAALAAATQAEDARVRAVQDDYSARLAAAERDCVTNAETAEEYLREYKVAEARVRELEADNANLRQTVANDTRAIAAESECAALRAALSIAQEAGQELRAEVDAAESRLAAANALLEQCLDELYRDGGCSLTRAISAHLAAQPATAPASDSCDSMREANELRLDAAQRHHDDSRGERSCRGCREGTQDRHTCQRAIVPPQTWVPPSVLRARLEAEQAVLDACESLTIRQYSDGSFLKPDYAETCRVMAAELARREAGRG